MDSKPLHLIIIGYVWPEPKSSAAGSRMMQLIHFFQDQQWKVTFASPATVSDPMTALASLGVDTISIQLNNPSFDPLITRLQPDIVVFDRFMMEEQFGWRVSKYCPKAIRILDTEDLHSLRQVRQNASRSKKKFSIEALKQSAIAKREIASIYRCDLSLMTSTFEIELLTTHFNVPKALLHHLPFMLDPITPETIASWPHFIQREHFVAIGNFRHEPNWDAVLYLKHELWPRIRKRLPNAELHCYGAYTPPKATSLHNPKQGFCIKGWTPDLELVMSQARVCMAPLRFGAGIKGKLTDAMHYGTPSITTSIGAESMHGDLPWNGIIANTTDDLVSAAVQLYTNQVLWKKSQEYAPPLINTFYNKSALRLLLLKKIQTLLQNTISHRMDNFTGSMLMHHTLKSTQYMSLWISEKNKEKDYK